MSAIPVSSALSSNLSSMRGRNLELAHAYETGAAVTKNATARRQQHVSRFAKQLLPRGPRKTQASPDRLASLQRKRALSGPSEMPDTLRGLYTPGEQACMVIIAHEVMKHGKCDFCIDKIAALAGVGRTTVQNALRKARDEHAHISVQFRPRRGLKNLTNVVRIVSSEWVAWLRNRIGFKKTNTTKKLNETLSQTENAGTFKGALEMERAGNAVPDAAALVLTARNMRCEWAMAATGGPAAWAATDEKLSRTVLGSPQARW